MEGLMASLTEHVVQSVGKHFVTLSCIQYLANDGPSKPLVFSGFMVDVSGEWFYVTAGHILRKISLALASGSSFGVWRFDDQTAGNEFNGKAVTYDFVETDWLVLEDEVKGLDYAALPLRNLYRLQLEVGNVVPIRRDAWSDHVTEFDHWIVFGMPSESVGYDGESIITGRITMSPIVPADEPTLAGRKSENQFYASVVEGSDTVFKNADGLSGSPVFALKKINAQWRYSVIGIQSGWYPDIRV